MFPILLSIFKFFVSNSRSFLILGVILGGAAVAHTVYNGIVDAAQNEIRIEQLKDNEVVYRSTIASQERAIAAQKKAAEILNEELDKREESLRVVSTRETKLKDSLVGPGMDEPASDYLKELIRTMGESP